jgi:transposase
VAIGVAGRLARPGLSRRSPRRPTSGCWSRDRRNWTIARLRAEIVEREGVHISRSQLSKALHKKIPLAAAAPTR